MVDADQAFEQFCQEAYPRLVGGLAHQCGSLEVAEDAAQESLIRACRRWEHVSRLDSPLGWCFHVGANVATSWFRRRRTERAATARLASAVSARADGGDDDEAIVLRASLQRLPRRQREALILRFLLDLPVEQVAQLTGSSPGAVRATTHRGVTALRAQLGPTWHSAV